MTRKTVSVFDTIGGMVLHGTVGIELGDSAGLHDFVELLIGHES